MTPEIATALDRAGVVLRRHPRSQWNLLAVALTPETARILPRGALVRELRDEDLDEIADVIERVRVPTAGFVAWVVTENDVAIVLVTTERGRASTRVVWPKDHA